MYIIISKAVEKRRTEYEMVTTNNTSQCLCHAKEGEIPQGQRIMGYCIDNTETLGMAQNYTYSSAILDFMITGSECHVTISKCLPHECQMFGFEFSDTFEEQGGNSLE